LSTFRLHEFCLGGGSRYYILLPKLTRAQIATFAHRFVGLGYATYLRGEGKVLRAARGRTVITVDSRGMCWSNEDAVDTVAPVLPEILAADKQGMPVGGLLRQYLDVQKGTRRGAKLVRLCPRMESSSLWRELRVGGLCALTPDEHTVFQALLLHVSSQCSLLTDYPTKDSVVRIFGKKQYFESTIETSEAASNLRMTGGRGTRNVYLPRDGFLRFSEFELPSKEKLADLLMGLGEWCFLYPELPSRR
jgi:hypothetical protein